MQVGAPAGLSTQMLFTSRQLGQIVTNTTAETAFAFQTACDIPAILRPGDVIVCEQEGVYQSGLEGAVKPFIRLGPVGTALTSRAVLVTTPAPVSGLLMSNVDLGWRARSRHVVQANGTSIVSSGELAFATGATIALMIEVNPIAAVTFDPTIVNRLTASAAWSMARAADQIRATIFTAEVRRPV